ncbi:hypothetical protein C2E23DRAFT_798662 [Lenzites betulinus]|nr:hypothetical protein C2E23DRAFT_798662 [Lenzites betulinus]
MPAVFPSVPSSSSFSLVALLLFPRTYCTSCVLCTSIHLSLRLSVCLHPVVHYNPYACLLSDLRLVGSNVRPALHCCASASQPVALCLESLSLSAASLTIF